MIKIFGECIVSSVHDTGTGDMHARVDRADPLILIADELLEQVRAGEQPPGSVDLVGDVISFGTEGLGVGRVSYVLGDRYDARSVEAARIA